MGAQRPTPGIGWSSQTLPLPHAPIVAHGPPGGGVPKGKQNIPLAVGVHPDPDGQSAAPLQATAQTLAKTAPWETQRFDAQSNPLPHGHPTPRAPGSTQNLPSASQSEPLGQPDTQALVQWPPPRILGAQTSEPQSGATSHRSPNARFFPARHRPTTWLPSWTWRHWPKPSQKPEHPAEQNPSAPVARQNNLLGQAKSLAHLPLTGAEARSGAQCWSFGRQALPPGQLPQLKPIGQASWLLQGRAQ